MLYIANNAKIVIALYRKVIKNTHTFAFCGAFWIAILYINWDCKENGTIVNNTESIHTWTFTPIIMKN